MTEPDPHYLFDLADALLGAVEDYYATNAIGPLSSNALPERRYVSDGLPAWDGEQVTVQVTRLFAVDENGGDGGGFPVGPFVRRGAEMVIQIIRAAPVMSDGSEDLVGEAPPPADIAASAQRKLADSQMIDQALITGYKDGTLPGCNGLFMVGWMSDGPEGGLVGGSVTVRMMLD